jgi:hypothetical protein
MKKIILRLLFLTVTLIMADERIETSMNCSSSCQQLIEQNQSNKIICKFNHLNDIKLACLNNQTNEILLISNNKNIILNRKLNLKQIQNSNVFYLILSRFNGFSLNNDDDQFKTKTTCNLIIHNSNFEFYTNKSKPMTQSQCNQAYFKDDDYQLFNINSHLILSKMNFNAEVCQYVFKNAHINYMHLNHQCDSFIEKNFIQFSQLFASNNNLNSKIYSLIFDNFYRVNLDESILNKFVFENLIEIRLSGTMKKIDNNIFSSFKLLKYIEIRVFNFKEFLSYGLDWMLNINKPCGITLDIYSSDSFREYILKIF